MVVSKLETIICPSVNDEVNRVFMLSSLPPNRPLLYKASLLYSEFISSLKFVCFIT